MPRTSKVFQKYNQGHHQKNPKHHRHHMMLSVPLEFTRRGGCLRLPSSASAYRADAVDLV
ncbi:hypothetical protein GE21DRAFT_1242992 [Neurospora crassa]|nr:hypothetical protein GE21DRAFT_1242992 [Neurospora crassa]